MLGSVRGGGGGEKEGGGWRLSLSHPHMLLGGFGDSLGKAVHGLARSAQYSALERYFFLDESSSLGCGRCTHQVTVLVQ